MMLLKIIPVTSITATRIIKLPVAGRREGRYRCYQLFDLLRSRTTHPWQ